MSADPPLCEACQKDPDPRGPSACFSCRHIAQQLATAPEALVGGPGWKKGVLDCIDVLYARQTNVQGDFFSEAIRHLQTLYKRDAK